MNWEITLVGVDEALDAQTAPIVKERLREVLDRPGPVVLDLRTASVDSTGLGTVLSLQRKLELQNRRLMVISNDPYLHRLLAVTGVGATLCVLRDVDEAIDHARKTRLAPAA
jgi:anti-anti-sigma factor